MYFDMFNYVYTHKNNKDINETKDDCSNNKEQDLANDNNKMLMRDKDDRDWILI